MDGVMIASLSSMGATVITNPLDVVKVRMQLRGAAVLGNGETHRHRIGVIPTATQVIRSEGVAALWRGTVVALMRSASYGGLRMGLYHPIKESLSFNNSEPGFGLKVAAGILAGTFAAGACSPLEMLKTRQQSHPDHGHVGGPLGALRRTVAESGVGSLWAGSQPAMVRGGLLTASQCACYEECKSAVETYLPEVQTGWPTHLAAALVTGLISTTVTNPPDVLKSYRYMRPNVSLGACIRELFRHEGPAAMFKGWTASYARVGPHTVLILVFNERIRSALGANEF